MRTHVLTKEKFVISLDNYKTSLSHEGLSLKNKGKKLSLPELKRKYVR